MRTLSADVTAGVERNPNSTITPAQHTPDPEMAAAIELLRQMGPELGADKALDIEGTLGEGGMGVVRLATQRSVGRKVALKTLRDGIERTLRERVPEITGVRDATDHETGTEPYMRRG